MREVDELRELARVARREAGKTNAAATAEALRSIARRYDRDADAIERAAAGGGKSVAAK
jgi:hypothetical protein